MSKQKKSQKNLINELKNQLLIQSERLGVRERYTPVALAEMELESIRRILTEFYAERSNLEYELNVFGSSKKEALIKLERLNSYVRKAETMLARSLKSYEKLLEKGQGDKAGALKAARRLNKEKRCRHYQLV